MFIIKKGLKTTTRKKVLHKCLSIIILDSVLYAYEKFHPQIFLQECKYVKENIKTNSYIDKKLKSEPDVIVIVIIIVIMMLILIMKNKFENVNHILIIINKF